MNGKAFLVLFLFLLLFITAISGVMGDTDLTPKGSGGSVLSGSNTSNSSGSSSVDLAQASQGPCSARYKIQTGDTLSSIATRCGLSLNDLLAANSSIQNPNYIVQGQEISIPQAPKSESAAAVNPTETARPAAQEATPIPNPTATKKQAVKNEPTKAPTVATGSEAGQVQITSTTGSKITVHGRGLQPDLKVKIQISKDPSGPFEDLAEANTDSSGNIKAEVTIPASYPPGENYTIAIVHDEDPVFVVTSVPQQVKESQ